MKGRFEHNVDVTIVEDGQVAMLPQKCSATTSVPNSAELHKVAAREESWPTPNLLSTLRILQRPTWALRGLWIWGPASTQIIWLSRKILRLKNIETDAALLTDLATKNLPIKTASFISFCMCFRYYNTVNLNTFHPVCIMKVLCVLVKLKQVFPKKYEILIWSQRSD